MELTKATELALSLMDKHDLNSWGFYMDNAKRRFGCCHYNTRSISLSKELVQANSEDRVKMTILHEIAHALVGHGNGHNRIWKNKCLEIAKLISLEKFILVGNKSPKSKVENKIIAESLEN